MSRHSWSKKEIIIKVQEPSLELVFLWMYRFPTIPVLLNAAKQTAWFCGTLNFTNKHADSGWSFLLAATTQRSPAVRTNSPLFDSSAALRHIYHRNRRQNVPPLLQQSGCCHRRIQRDWQRDCQSVWYENVFIYAGSLRLQRGVAHWTFLRLFCCCSFIVENGAKVAFCGRES